MNYSPLIHKKSINWSYYPLNSINFKDIYFFTQVIAFFLHLGTYIMRLYLIIFKILLAIDFHINMLMPISFVHSTCYSTMSLISDFVIGDVASSMARHSVASLRAKYYVRDYTALWRCDVKRHKTIQNGCLMTT